MAGRIVFENVWKRFHLGAAHDSLRDLIPSFGKRLAGQTPAKTDLGEGDFWAVRDVSFDVKPGHALGIIGGNGAGKSTTLKLLTKILRPTRGVALVEGRVGSLIEVSAGFHQDLTGRENVFLQGAIMGMPQKLIRERFDDIVEFSGVSAFIDTPVKRYSSGMNARLGFSIAVHLEPDVLIVDEVLSVGDAEFQGRAFDKIRNVVQSNIPVVIVSHQLDRVVELCSNCILLTKGEVTAEGPPAHVVQRYLGSFGGEAHGETPEVDGLKLTGLELETKAPIDAGDPVKFLVRGRLSTREIPAWLDIGITVRSATSNAIVYSTGHRTAGVLSNLQGDFAEMLQFGASVAPGSYVIELLLVNNQSGILTHGPAVFFEVTSKANFGGTHFLRLIPAQ